MTDKVRKGLAKVFKIGTVSFVASKISIKQSIQRMFYICFQPRLEFSKRESKINGSRSWYQMKFIARRKTHVKHESPSTYQRKVMTNFPKKVKLQGQGSEGLGHGIK
jgi:hypothetical protein